MRKLISLILVLITLLALCIPAMAEEDQYETVSYVYSSSGGSDNFSFYSNCQDTIENAWRAGNEHGYFELFANEKSGLQIKDIELRYVKGNFANAAISGGTKVDPDKYYRRGDWLRINNIHSKVFTMGTVDANRYKAVIFDEIRVYYEPIGTGSTISEGSIWIVAAVGACAVIAVAVFAAAKKKKQKAVEE